jgi:hypothetical protein
MEPRCYTEALKRILTLRLSFTFSLQTEKFRVWAMLGSNQRPLPCEGRSITPWLFATVQKCLQNRRFASGSIHGCSPSFAWVGVLLVYMSLTATLTLSHLCVVSRLLKYARRELQRRVSPHGAGPTLDTI